MRHITYKKLRNQMTDSRLWLDILSYSAFPLSLLSSLSLHPRNDVMMSRGAVSAFPVHNPRLPLHSLPTAAAPADWLLVTSPVSKTSLGRYDFTVCTAESNKWLTSSSLLSPPDLLPFTMKDTRDQASQTTWALREKDVHLQQRGLKHSVH